MSDTTAIPQADGVAAEQPTTLQRLNQAIFDYGAAYLAHQAARGAVNDASDEAIRTEDAMINLYRLFQAEQRGGK